MYEPILSLIFSAFSAFMAVGTTHFARNLVSGLLLVSMANHAPCTPATIGYFVPLVPGFLSSGCVAMCEGKGGECKLTNMLSRLLRVARKKCDKPCFISTGSSVR